MVDGRKRFKGELKGIEGSDVLLVMDENVYQIPFDAIAKAKIVLTDELLAKWAADHPETEAFIED